MDYLSRKRIIAAHYGICFGYRIYVIVDKIVGKFRSPLITVAAENYILAVLAHHGIESAHNLFDIVIALRSADFDDIAVVSDFVADCLSHLIPDCLVIK